MGSLLNQSSSLYRSSDNRRTGAVLVYAMTVLVVMLAVGTVAVDWGRVQLSKTQLMGAADASARAGAGGLASSPAAALDAAQWTASKNVVDGTALDLRAADVEIGTWSEANQTFTKLLGGDQYSANAVRVLAKRNTTRSSAVPTTFARAFGSPSTNLLCESIAMYVSPVNVDQPVAATANPFLAGMPAGSAASLNNPHNNPDYAGTAANPKQSPLTVNLPLKANASLTFDSISGTAQHDPGLALYQPDGQLDSIGHNTNGSENGIADATIPINALVGVFLDDNQPSLTAAPASLDFSSASSRDFQTLKPKLKQIFFIGDGLDASGHRQEFVVPQGATRLYLATWDFYEWNNNGGTRTVKVNRPGQVVTVK